MKLSRGARLCLKELRRFCSGKDHCWPSRTKLAKLLGVCPRQVTRYIIELTPKYVTSVSRRPNTSSVYYLAAKMSQPMSQPDVTSNYRTETNNEVRKPAGREPFQLPPREIANEYGRRMPNPDYLRIEEALRRARARIEAAGNPVAYERAIIQEELARAAIA